MKEVSQIVARLKKETGPSGVRILHIKIRVKDGKADLLAHRIEDPKVLSRIEGSPEDPLSQYSETLAQSFPAAFRKRPSIGTIGAISGPVGIPQVSAKGRAKTRP